MPSSQIWFSFIDFSQQLVIRKFDFECLSANFNCITTAGMSKAQIDSLKWLLEEVKEKKIGFDRDDQTFVCILKAPAGHREYNESRMKELSRIVFGRAAVYLEHVAQRIQRNLAELGD